MRVFPPFPYRIPAVVVGFVVYDMDCIARVVADKPGGSKYRNRCCSTSSQPRGKQSDPSGWCSLFSFNENLLFLFTPSLAIWVHSTNLAGTIM